MECRGQSPPSESTNKVENSNVEPQDSVNEQGTDAQRPEELSGWADLWGRSPEMPREPHCAWEQFVKTCGTHPACQEEVQYALPHDFLDAINREMPDFFSIDEAQFERELTTLSGGGFFLQRPFTHIALPRREFMREEETKVTELTLRQENSARDIRELIVEEMQTVGYSNEEIRRLEEDKALEKANVTKRQQGYAGWLVTNHVFHKERDLLRMKWASTIVELGTFPPIPMSLIRERPDPPPERHRLFYAEYCFFCRRWGLEGFATWHLPVPMQAQLSGPCLYYLPAIQDAGVLAFVPWYLLRDREIELHSLAKRVRMAMGPEHLRDWLDRTDKDFGHERFGKMLLIYVFIELGLKSRYADRCQGRVESLDRALGYYFALRSDGPTEAEKEAETVRKIRQEMNRRLKLFVESTTDQQRAQGEVEDLSDPLLS